VLGKIERLKSNRIKYELLVQGQVVEVSFNEHIFGTIKRQWAYNHTNLTGLEKVNGEHSLIMLVYNIKRAMNILGVPELIAKLKGWKSPYKREVLSLVKVSCFKLFKKVSVNFFYGNFYIVKPF
jgi:hypothetical protein